MDLMGYDLITLFEQSHDQLEDHPIQDLVSGW